MSELALELRRDRLDLVRHGAIVVVTSPAVLRVSGPGALTCLQGLLTNDLEKPGDGSLVYGALLTPKGMIVVDAWVVRLGDAFTLILPAGGREPVLDQFRRQLPPRLARVADLTGEASVAWLLGGHAFQVLAKSGIGCPESAGRAIAVGGDLSPVAIALAPESAPFVGLVAGLTPALEPMLARLLEAGGSMGSEADLHAARVLAGWPALGVEIDERTLPQEVRYDEIGGVSYTKGCYTGQETVARLHFRGHTNRELRGLRWSDLEPLEGAVVFQGQREVGSVRSTLTLEDRRLGLGLLRRDLSAGDTVTAGGRRARIVPLPFGADEVDG